MPVLHSDTWRFAGVYTILRSRPEHMSSAPAILAWTGSAHAGRVVLRSPLGVDESCPTLAELTERLRRRDDPWGGVVHCAAALGCALHGMQRALAGADLYCALDEASALLQPLPVAPLVARLRACVDKHRDILKWPECAARLVLEARRIQREQAEAVAAAIAEARLAIPANGGLLLAWPGGPGCDLGDGLLCGTVTAARRTGEVQVAGPTALAGETIAILAAHGLDAKPPTAAARAPAVVLLRCLGDGTLAEGSAVELAAEAARRGASVLAIGVRGDLPAGRDGLAPLTALPRLRRILITPPQVGS